MRPLTTREAACRYRFQISSGRSEPSPESMRRGAGVLAKAHKGIGIITGLSKNIVYNQAL